MIAKTKLKRIAGDTFALCTFSLFGGGGPCVLSTSNSAAEVCKDIPEHLQMEDETVCLVRVGHWVWSDGEMSPRDLTTIFQITPFETDALDDEEDCHGS